MKSTLAPFVDAPTVVDLFAGGGGFGAGFADEGFRIRCAVENNRVSCETYFRNVPADKVLQADVRNVDLDDVLGQPDVLIGGPPCEAFTVAAKNRRANPVDRLYKDPLGSLTLQFIMHLRAFEPRVFVMENVPGILEGGLPEELRMLFARAGYKRVYFNELLAEDVGTPSHRRRVFVSNVRLEPPRTKKRLTVEEAIGDIVDLDADVPNHAPAPVRGKRLSRIGDLAPGESLYRYKTQAGAVHGAWIRLHADRLAPTVMGSSRFVHPTEPRLLTPREHARLMGYPDDYVFEGSKNEQYEQAGESVPPPVSLALAREVRRALAEDG